MYCLESTDLARASGGRFTDVAQVRLDPSIPPRMVGEDVVVRVTPYAYANADWPYGGSEQAAPTADEIDVPLVAYHDWAQRGPSTMRVWLPTF